MKKCFKCGEVKQLDQFYKHPMMSDGHLNKCTECSKRDIRKNRKDNIEYYREYDRSRSMREGRVIARKIYADLKKNDDQFKERTYKLKRAWRDRNRIKRSAHIAVGNALKYAKIAKQCCEVCGEMKVEAHHDDYEKPLLVRWLCKKHHAEHHKLENERRRPKALEAPWFPQQQNRAQEMANLQEGEK